MMEVRFPVVVGAIVLVAVAVGLRSHFERMALAEERAFFLGRQSVPKSETPKQPQSEPLMSSNFAFYVNEKKANETT